MPTIVADVVDLEGIRRIFLTDEIETHALSDVSIRIKSGEYVAIAGPSGCGKSTLLSIMGLLDTPDAGTYRLSGQAVLALSPTERAHLRNHYIGFIFQSFNLIGELSVLENVALPLVYRNVPRVQRQSRAQEALETVGIGHRAHHRPSQLSGGQQQRVAVARALVGKPALLLADEPTGNLDSKNAETIMALLANLNRLGTTLVVVTHDLRFAQCADRVIQLLDGRIHADHAQCRRSLLDCTGPEDART